MGTGPLFAWLCIQFGYQLYSYTNLVLLAVFFLSLHSTMLLSKSQSKESYPEISRIFQAARYVHFFFWWVAMAWLKDRSPGYSYDGPLSRKVKLRVAHALGTFSLPPRVSDPDMHHSTCMMHVPWCAQGSLTGGFLWIWWRGKRFRHSRCLRNPQFYVYCKSPLPRGRHAPMITVWATLLTRSRWNIFRWLPSIWKWL